MKPEDIVAMLAGQTAIIAQLVELLVSQNALRQSDVTDAMNNLLARAEQDNPRSAAPIRHMLAMIKTQSPSIQH